jgi:hypothetical protein
VFPATHHTPSWEVIAKGSWTRSPFAGEGAKVTNSTTAWDEPDGLAARGTVVVLTGRGETPVSYQRFGRRLAADAYRVRVVQVGLDDLETARQDVAALLADDTLPAPKVLAGSDTGATFAARLATDLPSVGGVVLAGLALPGSVTVDEWAAELEARTACPTHRRVISEDDGFVRGALARPVTPAATAFAPFHGVKTAQLRIVAGAHHDVLNDVSHRSAAATVVLFLESLKLGSDLPAIVEHVQG